MDNERLAQARLHIENVVAGYRSDNTRNNLRWQVKSAYNISTELIAIGLVLAVVLPFGIAIRIYDYGKYNGLVIIFAFLPLVMMLLFKFITSRFKYFQEKYWINDRVSEEDILRLCENPDLKPLIILTYTSLLEELPDYLSRIVAYHLKKEREELLSKINQI
ncbi:hypothetical protein LEW62_004432 [Salmonella enterica]|nr:hypothetical protein [Salmonella enterica]ECQ4024549.1 hypothetical protein [Salmonella enterica]EDW0676720.1 hypothetical protein [Salmonella enterica subsp. enterica serovar Java]EIE8770590.1 hypothetical protein [Salmonella enterica]